MSDECLINEYHIELVEDFHSAGSGLYHVHVKLATDISACFPYLNAVLEDTVYDHENRILIGASNKKRYALRSHEIHAGVTIDATEAPAMAEAVVALVNRTWRERSQITPTTRERQLPTVYGIYQTLPRTNCRKCGQPTCLAFAGELRNGKVTLESCLLLAEPKYADNLEKLRAMFL